MYYGLTHSLELGAFFIQFLTWWQSENLQSQFIAYPIPNPPEVQFMIHFIIIKTIFVQVIQLNNIILNFNRVMTNIVISKTRINVQYV